MGAKRILHCSIGNMNVDGIASMLMQIYRNIDRKKIQFDFVVHDENENVYEREILELGGILYRVPFISIDPLNHIRQFDRILKEHPEYEVVHIHTTYGIMYFDAKIAKKNGRQVIIHSHNSDATKFHRLVHFFLKNKQSKIADYRLSCSYIAGKWMFREKDHYEIWKNAIRLESFRFDAERRKNMRNELGIKDNEILIGNVARLAYQKNQGLLIDIYQQYQKENTDSRLILVGGGEDEAKLRAKVREYGLEDFVIFTGNVTNVNDYMMAIDLFCLTSRWEGFGISMLEALTAGVVVTAPSLVDDLIKQLPHVHIVNTYENLNEWVCCLKEMRRLSDTERKICYQKMVDEGYDISTQAEIVMKYYEKLTGTGKK